MEINKSGVVAGRGRGSIKVLVNIYLCYLFYIFCRRGKFMHQGLGGWGEEPDGV